MIVRTATPEEAPELSALALRSKGHWGYSDAFLDACRDELTVDGERIGNDDYRVVVAERDGGLAGFYTLECQGKVAGEWELGALFVEPAAIGSGVGRRLTEHALDTLRAADARRVVIQGDPNATDFYLAMGATQTGTRESGSVPGRQLPLFEIRLD